MQLAIKDGNNEQLLSCLSHSKFNQKYTLKPESLWT